MKPEKIQRIKLVVSDEETPLIELKGSIQLRVDAVELVDQQLNPIGKVAARLCGGSRICMVLMDVGS